MSKKTNNQKKTSSKTEEPVPTETKKDIGGIQEEIKEETPTQADVDVKSEGEEDTSESSKASAPAATSTGTITKTFRTTQLSLINTRLNTFRSLVTKTQPTKAEVENRTAALYRAIRLANEAQPDERQEAWDMIYDFFATNFIVIAKPEMMQGVKADLQTRGVVETAITLLRFAVEKKSIAGLDQKRAVQLMGNDYLVRYLNVKLS